MKVFEELSAVLGKDVTLRILAKYGGTVIYVPQLDGYEGDKKTVDFILERHEEGFSLQSIADMTRLEVRTVIDILERQLSEHVK